MKFEIAFPWTGGWPIHGSEARRTESVTSLIALRKGGADGESPEGDALDGSPSRTSTALVFYESSRRRCRCLVNFRHDLCDFLVWSNSAL